MFNQLVDQISGSGWSYVLIFAFAYLDALVPIVPSETAVVTAGVLAGSGRMSLPLIIVLAASGAFAGDNTSYLIGRHYGEPAKRRFFSGKKARERIHWAEPRRWLALEISLWPSRYFANSFSQKAIASSSFP